MPVMDGYAFADSPHPSTVQVNGALYGCHSARTGDDKPRGTPTLYDAHPWAAQPPEPIVTSWLPIACGHLERSSDSACEGCTNRDRK